MRNKVWIVAGGLLAGWLAGACAYRLVPGPLVPLQEDRQGQGSEVADDGTVTYHIERLRISLRPLQDEELNRQFPYLSAGGKFSVNPYTYGNWIPEGAARTPTRFTIFMLKVENYAFPKVIVNPQSMHLRAQNGRTKKMAE